MATSQNNYFWIIGGGIMQAPLINEARKLGLKVLVTDKNPDSICKNLADFFYAVDIFDIKSNLELLSRLSIQNMNLVGILAAGIDANVTMAVLAKAAGLPGVDPKSAMIAHNKVLFRQFLTKNNFPHPKWEEVETKNQLKRAVNKIGYPLIIKNIDNSASRGITRFFTRPNEKELINALERAKAASSTGTALIEEFLVGEEQTVETIFDIKGKFWPCFITDRIFEKKGKWAIELGLRHPTALAKPMQKKLYDLVERTANKLNITIGAAKADTIVTSRGPIIIEMTTRLSGGFDCQVLVPAATGKNVMKAAILTSIGELFPKELLEDTKHRIGLTASIWPELGKITAIEGVEKAKKIPGFEAIFFRYRVGDIVESYMDCAKRSCYIIVTGDNEAVAKNSLEKALDIIQIKTMPI